ncbi:PilZ domain-containing protein [Pyruvatibacter sp.]|uniref:PilZ domain-containing protein n=1 Tax=Pyruvatibacter sp. TaxID=1981328 RepID=UPI0032EF340B
MADRYDPQTGEDRRAFPRIMLSNDARCLMPDGGEYPARLRDVSAAGCFLAMDAFATRPAPHDRVVVYIDRLGRFEGLVSRSTEEGFALAMEMTGAKRERLAVTLERIAKGDEAALDEIRRHPRVDAADKPTTLRLANGSTGSCRIIDMSLSGASVETNLRPTIGVFVDVGRMHGRVVRHHENGFAVEFAEVAPTPKAVMRHFEPGHHVG